MDNRETNSSVASLPISEFSLSGNDFLTLSNIILYNAINLYKKEFKSNKIPATFIKFYIYELSGYDYLFDDKLRQFFDQVESKKNRIAVMMKTFATSFPTFVLKMGEENYVYFLEVSKEDLPKSITDSSNKDKYLKSTIDSLNLAIKHYSKSDELRNISYIFKDYLYNTYTADALFEEDTNSSVATTSQDELVKLASEKDLDKTVADKIKNTTLEERHKKAALLTGRQIEIPKQKGRVVSVLFPVLPLPSAYPTLIEKSRINTERRAKHFLSPSAQITLINKYYFNQVKYSLDFINKRKVIAYDLKKASRFDFKF